MSPGAKAQRNRERLIAVGLTVSAYGAMFFFLTRPSPIPPFTDFEMGGAAITLVGMGKPSTSAADASDPLEALTRSLADSTFSDVQAPTERPKVTSLSELFGDSNEATLSTAEGAPSNGDATGVVRTGLVGDPGAQISGGRRNVAVGPDGQIPPCWRQPERRVPVKISIILDHQGGLIGPPEIVRARNAQNDEAQRAAETVAMRAMAGCAPFSLASTAGQYRSFELDFSKDRNWIRPTGHVVVR